MLRRLPSPALARLASSLVALALFGAPLLESAHDAAVRHVACPDDGELVDAPAPSGDVHAHGSAAAWSQEGGTEAPRGGRAHEHCLAALHGHLRATERRPLTALPLDPRPQAPPPAVTRPPRAIAQFRLAPKADPPQA